MRRAGRILVVVALVLLALAVAFVIASRAHLADSRRAVDARWTPLRSPLTERYLAVGEVNALAREVGGDRDVVRELDTALGEWRTTGATGRTARDPQAEVRLANRIEGLTARLVTNVHQVPKLAANTDLAKAADALAATVPANGLVEPYDRAVRRYKNDLDTLRNRPAAALFGFEARDAYEPPVGGGT